MDEEFQISPYATLYKRDTPTSRTIVSSGGRETGTVSGVREANRQAYEKAELDDAARRFSKDNMVSFETARSLMEKRLQAMQKQAEFKVNQEIRELDAQNAYAEAESDLAEVKPNATNAIDLYQAVINKHTDKLAGTKLWNDFSSRVKGLQMEALKFQKQSSLEQKTADTEALKAQSEATKATTEANRQRLAENRFNLQSQTASEGLALATIKDLTNQNKQIIPAGMTEYSLSSPIAIVNASGKGVDPKSKEATHYKFSDLGKNKKPIILPIEEVNRIKDTINKNKDKIQELSSKDYSIQPAKEEAPSDSEQPTSEAPATPASKPLTKEILSSMADELGPNATRESLMDLAKKRGYSF
jgi:DNA-dependent RNA polymerase auxiliary subunit epsilon